MDTKFPGLSAITEAFKNLPQMPKVAPYRPLIPDNRTRSERREDFEKELAALDKDALTKLLERIKEITERYEGYENALWENKDDIQNAISKLIKYIDKFENLNSEEARKIEFKRRELALETSHDWKEKFRTFFFRILASILFISTLFAIGYIEHEYEWARLPLSKYVSPAPSIPGK
jgi:DNA-directed RNA polymerase subunit F